MLNGRTHLHYQSEPFGNPDGIRDPDSTVYRIVQIVASQYISVLGVGGIQSALIWIASCEMGKSGGGWSPIIGGCQCR